MKVRSVLAGAVASALLPLCAYASTNLLTNGSFETGDLTGWTSFGDFSFSGVSGPFGPLNPEDGNFQVFLGSVDTTGGITQTFSDAAGQMLHVTGWYAGIGGPPSSLEISFNGMDIITLNPGPSDSTYRQFSADFVGTGSDTLKVTSFQLPSYNLVDNFSVTTAASAVPEPSTWAMMLIGFAVFGFAGFGRAKKSEISAIA